MELDNYVITWLLHDKKSEMLSYKASLLALAVYRYFPFLNIVASQTSPAWGIVSMFNSLLLRSSFDD